jgi:hypothetical protein
MRAHHHARFYSAILAFMCSWGCSAQTQGLKIILPAHAGAAYALSPGLYIYAQGRGPSSGSPGAGVLRVAKTDHGRLVSGSLELLRIDPEGRLLDLKSDVSSNASEPPCAEPTLYCVQQKNHMTSISFGPPQTVLNILDKPLSGMLGKVDSYMLQEGIRISWSGSASAIGEDRTGDYALFVPGSESDYRDMLAEYQALAAIKQKDVAVKNASADFIRTTMADFMRQSDSWMREPLDSSLQPLVEKARALYSQERASLATSDMNKARVAVMEINAIQFEAYTLGRGWEDEESFISNASASAERAYSMSPCFGIESSPSPDSPQACATLPPLIAAYNARVKELHARINEVQSLHQQMGASFECIVENSNHLVSPQQVQVSAQCKQGTAGS